MAKDIETDSLKQMCTPDRGKLSAENSLNAESATFLMLSTFCLFGAAIGGFVTTYFGTIGILNWLAGAHENAETIAFMVSFLATGLNFVAFSGTIRLLPLYRTSSAKLIGVFVLCCLLALSVSALTSTSIIGMTGTSARAMYLMSEARRLGLQVTSLTERVLSLREFADYLEPEAITVCETAETEQRTGALSGSPGPGPISEGLQSLCTRKSAIAKAVQQNIAATVPLIAELNQLTRELDALIIDKSLPIDEREIAFIRRARKLEARMMDLRAADRTRAIHSSYGAMEAAVDGLEEVKADVRPGQATAINVMIARERGTAKQVRNFLAAVEAQKLPETYRTELVPMPRLVWRYAADHWPQFALALLVDAFGPLVALLAWAAAMRRRNTPPARSNTEDSR